MNELIKLSEQLFMQAQINLETKKKLEAQEERIAILEAKEAGKIKDYFSIKAYAAIKGVKVNLEILQNLGKLAIDLSKQHRIAISKVTDERFRLVNGYHVSILKIAFGLAQQFGWWDN